jgi:tetratricopeptide (TPR) repeat protein
VFDQVRKILPEEIRQHGQSLPILTLADCENRLVYTPFERYQNAQFVLKRLINKPPFTNQSYSHELTTQLVSEVDTLRKEIRPEMEKILSMYDERITQHPRDWKLRWKLADLYYQDPATYAEAAVQLHTILLHLPYYKAYEGLVKILIHQNKLDEAERYCQEMIGMKPLSAGAYSDLGNIFRKKGAYDNAVKYLSRAIELQPAESIHAYGYLAEVFVKKGNPEKAINTFYEAIDHSPKELTAMVHVHLGLLLAKEKRTEEAVEILRTAIATFPPEEIKKETDVFELLLQSGHIELALEFYRQQLKVKPDSIAILNNLAWIQATHADETIRNPEEAVEYAEKACTLTGYKSPGALDTLAAAYASSGDFERAVMTAQKAVTLATKEGNPALAETIESHLRLYQSGQMLFETYQ